MFHNRGLGGLILLVGVEFESPDNANHAEPIQSANPVWRRKSECSGGEI